MQDPHNTTIKRRITVQSVAALLLIVSGIVMLMCSIYLPPQGEIHPTVLFAFGEILVAAGTFLGVDLHYSFKHYSEYVKHLNQTPNQRKEVSNNETL